MSTTEHGFLFGRSCLTNLLESLDNWTAILDTGNVVDIVFLDLCKAFNSVLHKRLSYNETICLWYSRQDSYVVVQVFARQTSEGCVEPS